MYDGYPKIKFWIPKMLASEFWIAKILINGSINRVMAIKISRNNFFFCYLKLSIGYSKMNYGYPKIRNL